MSLNHSPKIVTDGLVLCLDAASRKSYPGSGTTWFDRSGNGNNGTLVNGVGYNSGNGGSLLLDGLNDHILLPNAGIRNLLSSDCTIEMVLSYSSGVGLIYPTLIGSMIYGTNWTGWRLVFIAATRTLDFTHASGSNFNNQSYISFNYVFPDDINKFTHIVCTWVASTGAKNTYINGVLTNSINSSLYAFGEYTSGTTKIGALTNDQTDNMFKGRVANTRLYNKALTSQEILQNFNATRGRYGV